MGIEFFFGLLVYSIIAGAIYQCFVNFKKGTVSKNIKEYLKSIVVAVKTLKIPEYKIKKQNSIKFAYAALLGCIIELLIPFSIVFEKIKELI